MATQFTKHLLSASVDGQQIAVTATGTSSPTLIHTAQSGTVALDEVYLYAANADPNGYSQTITILHGGTNAADYVKVAVPANQGRLMIADGKLITNGKSIQAFTSHGTLAPIIDGFVNRITST